MILFINGILPSNGALNWSTTMSEICHSWKRRVLRLQAGKRRYLVKGCFGEDPSLSGNVVSRPRGLMDKASDFGSEDCEFESRRGRWDCVSSRCVLGTNFFLILLNFNFFIFLYYVISHFFNFFALNLVVFLFPALSEIKYFFWTFLFGDWLNVYFLLTVIVVCYLQVKVMLPVELFAFLNGLRQRFVSCFWKQQHQKSGSERNSAECYER